MKFKLPNLPYEYNALEPYIDARTMEIHHSKHHNGYTNNLNKAIEGTNLDGLTIEEICKSTGLSGAVARNNVWRLLQSLLVLEYFKPRWRRN